MKGLKVIHDMAKGLTKHISKNIKTIKEIFADVEVVKYRYIEIDINNRLTRICFVFTDGLVNSEIIDGYILKPLMRRHMVEDNQDTMSYLVNNVIQVNSISKTDDLNTIMESVSYGDSLLLIDGYADALLLDTKQFVTRSISEPDGEKILSGPREGFTESLLQNVSMIRRKIRTDGLKLKFQSLGVRSNTQICIAYMEDIVDKDILETLYARLAKINIDAVLDSHYITELIRDHKWSMFRTTGYTERPDVVAGKLMEGRIALFVDGTPVVITIPYLFVENFQSNEDYYLSFYYTSFSRLLRTFGFSLAIAVPAIYVAMVSYHQEMLPSPLFINIATESHNMPLPASFEAFLLLIMFDLLRETGIRMPLGVGQALSIVGALVVGSAAVEANLVSATIIIITAISGITSLLIPKMSAPIVIYRLILLIFASTFGFFGITLSLAALLIHILTLESFGVPQFTMDKPFKFQSNKDTFIRAPWWKMLTRPVSLTKNRVRQGSNKTP